MAVEIERLVATLSADINRFEKQFAKAGAVANKELAAIERRGSAFAANINTAMAGASRGFEATGRNVNALRGQTGNLASQFQDIAVQLQGGASPLTIALQQGTQITQVLGPLGAGGAVRALGGAFLSLLNPVSLLTIGIIAAGGAAVQYFASVLSDGEASAETIKKQADLVRQVAKEWGNAIPALQAYVAELDKADQAAALGDAVNTFSAAKYEPVRDSIGEINVGLAEVVDLLRIAGAEDVQIVALQRAFNDLSAGVEDGTANQEQLNAVSGAFASITEGSTIPAVVNWGNSFIDFAAKVQVAIAAVVGLNQQVAQTQIKTNNLGIIKPVYSGGGKFINEADVMNERANGTQSQFQIAAEKATRRGGGGSGKSEAQREREQAAEAAKREREAVESLIESLMFEASLVGKTKEEKAAANAVRRAGAAATGEERQFIEAATIALMQQEEAIRANKEAMQEMQDMTKGFLNDFFSGIEQGKSVWESFGDAALNVLGKITDKLLDDVLNAIFDVNGALGSGGGGLLGFLGGLFGGGGGGADPWGGMRANGGPVSSGKAYMVGERGPEMIVPRNAGTVIPNKALGGGGSNQTSVTYHIDARGAVEGTAEQIRKAIDANNRSAVPQISVQSIQRAQKYGKMPR